MKLTPIVKWNEIDYDALFDCYPALPRSRGNNKGSAEWLYRDMVCAFDIETTYLKEIDRSVMYLWQFQLDESYTVMGRTWDEYKRFMHQLRLYLHSGLRLYIAVHNLSFEWQYLRGIYDFTSDEIFALQPRKMLHCSMYDNRLQYFCSYKHSNMSLAKYCEAMGVEHGKQSGEEYDYSIRRYPWTPLKPHEIKYGQHDVVGLVEAIKTDLVKGGDTLYSLPMTSTGYVRREIRSALKKSGYSVKPILPNLHIYNLLEEAMRGGNTHANRYYVGRVIKGVKSADRKSSYPEVIENMRYPMGRWEKVEEPDVGKFLHYSKARGKAVLMRIKIWGLRLEHWWWPMPYIPKSKTRNLVSVDVEQEDGTKKRVNPVIDNGRVLSAPYLEITITDVDFEIIDNEYTWDRMEIEEMYISRYAYLPQAVRDECRSYFQGKSDLDGVVGQEYYYGKKKNLLNGIYGMFAQAVIRDKLILKDNKVQKDDTVNRADVYDEMCQKVFLAYAWGVWVTAWARYELERGIRIAGEYAIYCDTDSVKYLDGKGIDFSAYNKEKIRLSQKNRAYATAPDGSTLYMGVYECDGEYDEFATWGSKKYCSTKDGKLSLTISGVNKKLGALELAENGGIERFVANDFTFIKAGGKEARYYDGGQDFDYEVEPGRFVHIQACCSIVDSTYKMGISGEYERLLKGIKNENNA